MKQLLAIILLCFYIFNLNAQDDLSVESLSKRSKTTQKEKKDATIIIKHDSDWWKVDDDVNDTYGLTYTFVPYFPLSFSVNGTWSYFQLGGEFGITLSEKEFEYNENATAKPLGYLMASPGFYYKFFSVQCGVGTLFGVRKETNISTGTNITQTTSSSTIDLSTSNSSYTYEINYQDIFYETSKSDFNLCFKPSVTGYIPIRDGDYYITINAGYFFVPRLKDLNGFTVGVGVQITI